MFIEGPEVSLKGSPTVSPTTAAAWVSEPLPPRLPFSMYFLALSHAPPALAIISAINTQPKRPPASMPPNEVAPRPKPTTTGARTAMAPGTTMRLSAAVVAISTQRAVSGSAVPSKRPGISRNCRRISLIISNAASPTAVMVMDAIRKGIVPPMKMPISTSGLESSSANPGLLIVTVSTNAAIIARAARAAAPIAKPLPMAAVVLPTSSRPSVIARVSAPMPAISAMPPALSATGP